MAESPSRQLRTTRALRTLTRCHRAMVSATDVDELMHDVCAIAVESGYKLAWVGRCEGTEVRPIASAGREARDLEYVEKANLTTLDEPRGHGPGGRAIRTGKPAACRFMEQDPSFAPWCAAALERGYLSNIALPLGEAGRPWGFIAIYAEQPDAFDDDEVALLQDLASSLSYGVAAVRAREAQRESEERHRLLFERLPLPYDAVDGAGRVVAVNDAWLQALGYERDEVIGRSVTDFLAPSERSVFADRFERFKQTGALDVDIQMRRKDGVELTMSMVGRVALDERGAFKQTHCVLTDVTERRRVQRRLAEGEARFRSLFESAIEGIALHELVRDEHGRAVDYRIVDVNRAFAKHTGIAVERARGALASELYGSGEAPYLEAYVRAAEGEPCRFDVTFAPLGRDFRITAFQQGTDGFATVLEDVTQRKRDEEMLRLSELRLAALHELSQREFASEREAIEFALEKAVEVTGSEIAYLHFVEPDQEHLSSFAWSKKALEQCTTPTDRHYPLSQAGIWADCVRLRHPVVHNDYPSEPQKKGLPEGHAPVVRHMSACVIDKGKVVLVLGVGNKQTDYRQDDVQQLQLFLDGMWGVIARLRAAEQLKASAERWRTTFDAIQDAVCVVSPSHELVEANEAACKLFVLPPEQVRGRKCYELMHGTSGPIPGCPCDAAARTGEYSRLELAQGNRVYDLTAWPIRQRDGLGGVVHVIEDVTEDKRRERERAGLQEQLRMSQKLEAVGSLAGGIAHDFNNLLTVINSYAQFALDQLEQAAPVREDISEILQAGERAALLTRQLLAFSRKQMLCPEVMDVNAIVTGMEGMLRRLIGENIKLRAELKPNLARIKADPGQLAQAVMNIAINARDAMKDGGQLTIETQNVLLDEEFAAAHVSVVPGPHVLVSFADTGVGMDEATRARVFEPFFTTKPRGKGTGLGLATVYGIVKQSGGNIWVHSEPGKGTTFELYFPAEAGEGAAHPSMGPRMTLTGSETVLVVEDEEGVRKLARRILEKAGYEVLVAENGAEALVVCERHKGSLDLVLTDVVMPLMSGKELVQRLSRLRRDVKVLYMSGYTDNAIVHHGVLDAGTNFIAKPFSAHDLTRKVREVLDSPQPRPLPPRVE